MLNEEEISKLKINVFNQCDDETIRLVAEMLKHIDQLESDKQKLIKKLEEICEKVDNEMADFEAIDLKYKILEILKGENQITVK